VARVTGCLEALLLKLASEPSWRVAGSKGFVACALPTVVDAAAVQLRAVHTRRLELLEEAEGLRERLRHRESELQHFRELVEHKKWYPSQEAAAAESRLFRAYERQGLLEARLKVVVAHRDTLQHEVGGAFERERAAWAEQRSALAAECEQLVAAREEQNAQLAQARERLAALQDEVTRVNRLCASFEQQVLQLPESEEELRERQAEWVSLFEQLQEKERRAGRRGSRGRRGKAQRQSAAARGAEARSSSQDPGMDSSSQGPGLDLPPPLPALAATI